MLRPTGTLVIVAVLAAVPTLGAQDTLSPPWHRVTRAYDLTPDSVLDTLTLQVWRNPRSDTLRVVLHIRGFGREIYRHTWSETYDSPEPFAVPTTREAWALGMRDHLDLFFDDSHFIAPRTYTPPENLISGFDCSDPDPRGCIAWYAAHDAVLARWKRLGRPTEPRGDIGSFYRALHAQSWQSP
jgi:hypothetical protein